MLSLMQLFAVAVPQRAQTPSEKVSDPFRSLQQSLDLAADEQLAVRQGEPVANTVPRSMEDSRPHGGSFTSNKKKGSSREEGHLRRSGFSRWGSMRERFFVSSVSRFRC
jgi:hypothetical protein